MDYAACSCPAVLVDDSELRMDKNTPDNQTPLLEVQNLSVAYTTEKGTLNTVRNVSLKINFGEIYGLVGESGSGKTTLARGIVRYLPRNGQISSGRVLLNGLNLLDLSPKEIRRIWGSRIAMVHQDPVGAVNPAIPVGEQVAEVARVHLGMSRSQASQKALEMLAKVQLPDPESVARRYAHQLSGGMLQRILIAQALITSPELLIMDEPTTALDVTTEAVILDLVGDLLKEFRTAVLYITHHLGVVARICNRVGVMYAGELMEEGSISQVFQDNVHPYTLGLLSCVPRVDMDKRDIALHTIPGFIPRPDSLPDGCIYSPRCALAQDACRIARPPLEEVSPGHFSACLRWAEVEDNLDRIIPPSTISDTVKHQEGDLVLDARSIKKYYKINRRGLANLFDWRPSILRAVDNISVRIRRAHTLGIVGESGCGKTTFARTIAGLVEATSGDIILEKEPLALNVNKRPRKVLKKIQVVFQNPDASLNPQHSVGYSVGRPLELLGNVPKKDVARRVKELFAAVNLPADYIHRLPHELSGGEKQRVAIARAFAANPTLMICDEPISSLDVSVQASLMNLLIDLQDKSGTTYLFISHDLAAVRYLSDWIAVIYLGRIWEIGSAEDVFSPPYHPYTEALLSAIPVPDLNVHQERIRLEGSVPSAMDIPLGCRFHTRCPRKIGPICETEEPPWQNVSRYHSICCHIPLDELQKSQSPVLDQIKEERP
jgi:peptide/nickel transport system ATP-binding protein